MMELLLLPTLAEAFDRSGLPYPGEPSLGCIKRFSTNGVPSDRAGWLKVFADGAGAVFGCWREGATFCWQERAPAAPPPSPGEREALRRKAEEVRREADAQRAVEQAQVAKECAAIWDGLSCAGAEHPYLSSHGVAPHVSRHDGAGNLVVPVFGEGGELQSLQTIAADGTKRFWPGAKMKGGRLFLGGPADGSPWALVEGFATGAAVHEATKVTVCVAFSGSNLEPVAASLRRTFPRSAILVAADLDENGAGLCYAQAAAKASMPAQVVLPVFKDARTTGDFCDLALAEGQEEVRRQVRTALRPPAPPFPFISAGELLAGPKASQWLIRGWIEGGALAMLFGESTAGKSFLSLDWAACIATDTPWNGCTVEAGPVFYIDGEGHAGLGKRLAAWGHHHGTPVADAPLYVSRRAASLMDEDEAEAVAETVRTLCTQHGPPRLVVVDTYARNTGGADENSAQDVGRFIGHLDRHIREPLGCAVLLVHHTGHTDRERARGSSAFKAATDAEFCLALTGQSHRTLTCTKQRNHEKPAPVHLDGRQVILDDPWTDAETGEPMTSLVLLPTAEGPKASGPPKGPAGENRRIALDCCRCWPKSATICRDRRIEG